MLLYTSLWKVWPFLIERGQWPVFEPPGIRGEEQKTARTWQQSTLTHEQLRVAAWQTTAASTIKVISAIFKVIVIPVDDHTIWSDSQRLTPTAHTHTHTNTHTCSYTEQMQPITAEFQLRLSKFSKILRLHAILKCSKVFAGRPIKQTKICTEDKTRSLIKLTRTRLRRKIDNLGISRQELGIA